MWNLVEHWNLFVLAFCCWLHWGAKNPCTTCYSNRRVIWFFKHQHCIRRLQGGGLGQEEAETRSGELSSSGCCSDIKLMSSLLEAYMMRGGFASVTIAILYTLWPFSFTCFTCAIVCVVSVLAIRLQTTMLLVTDLSWVLSLECLTIWGLPLMFCLLRYVEIALHFSICFIMFPPVSAYFFGHQAYFRLQNVLGTVYSSKSSTRFSQLMW